MGSVGFAFGIERLADLIDERVDYTHKVLAQFVPLDEASRDYLIEIMQSVRTSGISADMNYDKLNLKGGFKSAENNNARFIIIAGENEVKSNQVTIKVKSADGNQDNDIQEVISKDLLIQYIIATLKTRHRCETCDKESCEECTK